MVTIAFYIESRNNPLKFQISAIIIEYHPAGERYAGPSKPGRAGALLPPSQWSGDGSYDGCGTLAVCAKRRCKASTA